jgi:hypothetical protein
MPYPGNFLRLVVGGSLYLVEDWTWSLSIVPNFETTPDNFEAVPQNVIDAVTAFHTATGVTGINAKMEYIKLNMIGPDGKYADQTDTRQHDFPSAINGAGGTNVVPQVALAVSLMTANRRGPAHAGRFYLPHPAAAIDSTGRIASASATTVATAATTMINALNAAIPYGDVGVASDVGEGKFLPCTGVRVGRVLDTIRSRREKFAEEYVLGAAIDPGAD